MADSPCQENSDSTYGLINKSECDGGLSGPAMTALCDGVGQYGTWPRSSIQMALDEGSGTFGGGGGEDLFGWALFLDAAGVEEDRAG